MKNTALAFFVLLGFSLSADAQTGETYQFQHQIEMKIESFKKDRLENTLNYVMLLPNDNQDRLGTELKMEAQGRKVDATVVFDLKSNSYIMLMNQAGMKIGIKNRMDPSTEKNNGQSQNLNFQKTGRSKSILGYPCQEYKLTYEEGYALLWVTEELQLKSFFGSLAELSKNSQYANFELPFEGYIMELTAYEKGKKPGDKTVMKVTKVNLNAPKTISTAGYQLMGG